jgi:hypothetical protein
MANYPKFDKYIDDKAAQRHMGSPVPRYGIISSYDPNNNTATVILSAPDSDGIQQILDKVPCPTYMGLQMAAPEPGRPCFVTFLSSRNESRPVITHFFNHLYQKRDYYRHTDARSGVSQFYLNM